MTKTIILCSILAIIVFCIQLSLCLKFNKNTVKLIPIYIIVIIYLISIILYCVDVFDGSGGVAIWVIFAFIISIANTVALVSDIFAWIIYRKIQKRK